VKEVDRVWLACAIDGEGTINEQLKRGKYKTIKVQIGNTSEEFIKKASKLMRTKYYRIHRATRKPFFIVEACKRNLVLEILREVLPHLIIKRDIAEKEIEWIQKNPPLSPSECLKRAHEARRKKFAKLW